MGMRDDDPMKIEEIRRFSAIYGRFDCKRKPQKPLTMHEVRCRTMELKTCCISVVQLRCRKKSIDY